MSFEHLWKEIVESQFPKVADDTANANKALANLNKFADEKVDAMRQQKDDELEHYKKEISRAKRFEQKGAAGRP